MCIAHLKRLKISRGDCENMRGRGRGSGGEEEVGEEEREKKR